MPLSSRPAPISVARPSNPQQRSSVMSPPSRRSAAAYYAQQPASTPSIDNSPYSAQRHLPHLHPSSSQQQQQQQQQSAYQPPHPRPVPGSTAPLQRVLSELEGGNQLDALTSGPSLQTAVEYRNATCPRHHAHSQSPYSPWQLSDADIGKYGLGTLLYFQQTRRLSQLFLLMFLLSVPALYFNVQGDGSNYPLTRTTMGNLGLDNATLPLNSTLIAGYDKQFIGLVTSICDLAYTVLFLLFILVSLGCHRRETSNYHASILTVSRYSVAVSNLPRGGFSREQLRQHFSQFGPVVDVSFLYSNFALVELYCERGKMRKQLADLEHAYLQSESHSDQRRIHELRVRIATLDHRIHVEKATTGIHVIAAYVTFESQTDSDACLQHYLDNWLYRLFMPRFLRFRGNRLKVIRAPEPSNILYHNIGYSRQSKQFRRLMTGIVSVLLLSVTTAVVYTAQYVHNNSIPQVSGCVDGNAPPADYDVNAAYHDNADGSQTDVIDCFCSLLSLTALLTQYRTACTHYIQSYALNNSLVFLTAITTIVINALIHATVSKISRLEIHASRSSQQMNMARKLAIGLTINTGIIIILVNADLSVIWQALNLSLFNNSGGYSDLTTDWYNTVGSSVTITMIIGIAIPTVLQLPKILYDAYKRRLKSTDLSTVRNQEELNQIFAGRHFTLDARYAQLLVVSCVSLMYSGGIPLMLLIASLRFGMTYWCDRIAFCQLYAKPPRYDEHLDRFYLHSLPVAALLHCVMNIGFYSSVVTESYGLSSVSDSVSHSYGELLAKYGDVDTGLNLVGKLSQLDTLPFLVLAALLVLNYTLRPVLQLLLCSCCSQRQDQLSLILPHYFGVLGNRPTYYEAMRRVRLESYRLSRQPHWKLAYMLTHSRKQLEAEMDFPDVAMRMREMKAEMQREAEERGEQRLTAEANDCSAAAAAHERTRMQSVSLLNYAGAAAPQAWSVAGLQPSVVDSALTLEKTRRSVHEPPAAAAAHQAAVLSASHLHSYHEASERSQSVSSYQPPSPHRRAMSVAALPEVEELEEPLPGQMPPSPAEPPPPPYSAVSHSRSQSHMQPSSSQAPKLIVVHRDDAARGQHTQHSHSRSLPVPGPAAAGLSYARTAMAPSAGSSPLPSPALPYRTAPSSFAVPRAAASLSPPPPLSPSSAQFFTAPPASRPPPPKLLSSLSLSALSSLSPQSLELLWSQYDTEGRGRLRRRELKQLAYDCVMRVIAMVDSEIRRQHADWSDQEVAVGVRQELRFILPTGHKDSDNMEELQRMMYRRLTRSLDVNGDGDISKQELLTSWNAFSSEMFQLKGGSGQQNTLECCLM